MIGREIAAAMVLALAGTATPALACSIVATRPICSDAGTACTGELRAQRIRERDQRVAIEYGRELNAAVEARRDSAVLDRGYDLARILLPNLVLPVATGEDSCNGWTADDEDGSGHAEIADAERIIRQEAGMAADAVVDFELVSYFAARRTRCNAEIRRDLGTYLTGALPAAQLRDLWDFLVPRAGAYVPTDGAQEIGGARLLYFGEDGALRIPDGEGGGPPYVANRRERAWQYLANHRNGRAVMSALNQFVAARVASGRDEAMLCPATMRGQV